MRPALPITGFLLVSGTFLCFSFHGGAQVSKTKVQMEEIPLREIYTTSDQEGTKKVPGQGGDVAAKHLQAILETQGLMGASNAFLARGKDIGTAVRATRAVFVFGHSADVPADRVDGPKEKQHWVVAYFGVGGVGSRWVIRSVSRNGDRFRITFGKGRIAEVSVSQQYFAWIPVGELSPGTYSIELFDAENKQLSLSRTVTVPR